MRAGGWSGPAAALVFLTAVAGFAARRTDGYSHGTKAVSELGAIGAPDASLFNLLGFVLPGLLIATVAWTLHRAIADPGCSILGPDLLAASGLAMSVAGLSPVNMDALSSATSIGHVLAVQVSGLTFVIALFVLGLRMRRDPQWRDFGRITPWFTLFLVANVVWQVVWRATGDLLPGWGQRIGFLGYFAWAALAGAHVLRSARPASDAGRA